MLAVATPQPVPAQPPSRSEIERKLSIRSTVAPRPPTESPKKHRKSSHPPPPHTYPHAHPHALSGNESDSSIASSSIPGLASPNPGSASATSNHPGSPLLTPAGTSVGGLSAIAERQFGSAGGPGGSAGGVGDEEIEGMGMVDLEDVEEEEEGEGESGSEVEAEGAGELERGMEGERVVKSGYLWKKQERRKAWKKRWFVLRTGKLAYYKDEKEYSLKRVLDLHQVHTVAPVTVKKHPHSFGIVVPKRTFFVKAASANDMEEWVHAINGVRRRLSERDEEERMKREKGEAHHHHAHPHGGQARTASVAIPPRATPSGLHAIDTTSPTSTTASYFGGADRPIASPQPMSATPQTATSMFASPSSPVDREGAGNLTSQFAKIAIPSRSPSGQSVTAMQSQPVAGFAGSPRRTSVPGVGGQPRGLSGNSAKREPSASSISSTAEYFPRGVTSPIVPAPASSEDEDDLESELPPPGAVSAHVAAGGLAHPVEAPIDPNKVILSAYLMKRSKGRGTGRKVWRKRWFVLTSQGVTYTKSHMENRAPQFIPLSSVLDALEVDAPSPTDSDDSDRLSAHGHTHPGHPHAHQHGHPHGHPAHGQSPPARQGFPIRGRLGSQDPSTRKPPGTPGSHPPAQQAPPQPAHVEEQHIFRLITAKRTYVLCAPTEEDEIKWLAAFRALLNRERAGAAGAGPGTPFSPQSGFANLPTNPPGSPTPNAPSSSLSAAAAAGAGGRRPSVPFITQQPPTPATGPPALAPETLASGPTLGEVAPVTGATPSAGTAPGPPATSGTGVGVGHPPQHAPMNRGRSATYTAKSAVADVVRRFHPEKEKEV
ncbi:hypothetical protein IAT38_002600 [Cryptococcus sp. DSM 104549]